MNNLNYGVIGNCKSAALISESGSIEWCCLPDFNSSSVFAKILDDEKGGAFEIIVDDDYTRHQKYIKNTNILCTHYSRKNDAFEILDFMHAFPGGRKQQNTLTFCQCLPC